MKKLIILLAVLLTGCDLSTRQRVTEYEDIFAGGKRYAFVCIDYVLYIQNNNNGSLTPKYQRGSNTPSSCENKQEASK